MIPSANLLAELKACTSSRNLERGRRIHEAAIRSGRDCCDAFFASTLINMYAKCGHMEDARSAFEKVCYQDVVSWTALILGYAANGDGARALELFSRMRLQGFAPNEITFVAALKACNDLALKDEHNDKKRSRVRGRQLHLLASISGCDSDRYVGNTLIDMYARCKSMDDAFSVFEKKRNRDVVSWNALIAGCAENGEHFLALDLFFRMKLEKCAPDTRTFLSALLACSDLADKEGGKPESRRRGKQMHLLSSMHGCTDLFLENTFVDLYSKCGSMADARSVFEQMQHRDVVTWTSIILGYADNGEGETGLDLMSRMRDRGCEPDSRTFVAAFKACTALSQSVTEAGVTRERGRALHLLAVKKGVDSDSFVKCALVDMYTKSGSMEVARMVSFGMHSRDVSVWNALILGYVDNGSAAAALNLFVHMRDEGCVPNDRTFAAALKACADSELKEEDEMLTERGRVLHLLAIKSGYESDTYIKVTLVDMYAKCGSMRDARRVFESLKHPNVVCWTALMLGYMDNGEGALSLELFSRMKSQGVEPDGFTFAAVLKACSMLGALDFGKAIYAEILSRRLEKDAVLATCLVDFYAKCGSLAEAKRVFELHGRRDLMTWNVLMSGYSRRGDTEAVFTLFDMMRETNAQPDGISLLCVLTACSHVGLVDKGKAYFDSMVTKFGVCYEMEHYTCMVDIFGRANKLDHALALVRSMLLPENVVIWMTVLGACRKWKNVVLGRLAFETLMSLDDKNPPAYVLMANIYGSKGMWADQALMQVTRKKLQVWKCPGQSLWTSKAGKVHTFMAGDRNHQQSQEIRDKMKNLVKRMKEHGYVADLSSVTSNMTDDEKEDALCGHSERLAIACALINTSPGETIRIIKNLRVCDDCHAATSLISKLEDRTILCRDSGRFHVFKDGKCSCGDFW